MKKAISGGLVQFTFEGLDPLTFDPAKASAANREYAALHGWMARLGNAAALSRTMKDGTVRTVTEAMRRDAVAELVAFYESGAEAWEPKGGTRQAFNPQIQKIAAAKGISYAEAQIWWADHEAAILAMA